ncbi:diaminopimelate epimerase [uncultured Prochlorococcus sp.]|uniref:diaminopimelate epimerase n=1 Tax=uncultured Prochlorococcus sp. TaxID=159733 RepID=UPI0025877548|nr:diaminopimelate epimerase [uncultured Prochlorococcus sp.]
MKNITFEKYQGNGNDFVIIDSRGNELYKNYKTNKIFDIKKICNRQFGVGADGLIFIEEPNEDNYAKMIIFNSDGSEAQMCGNGIRCLVEYLHVNDSMNNKNIEYKIETKAGLKIAKYINDEITVKMGVPIFECQNIPTTIEKKINSIPSHEFIEKDFNNMGYAVGMGNPHLIFFVKDIESIVLSRLGPIFEKNELFPEKTNVHFCQILNRDNIKVKVWERGAGPTLACGTGACAIHVAAYKLGHCNSQTIVTLPGGNLKIDWSKDDCEVMMTGNAKKVFSGSMLVN